MNACCGFQPAARVSPRCLRRVATADWPKVNERIPVPLRPFPWWPDAAFASIRVHFPLQTRGRRAVGIGDNGSGFLLEARRFGQGKEDHFFASHGTDVMVHG